METDFFGNKFDKVLGMTLEDAFKQFDVYENLRSYKEPPIEHSRSMSGNPEWVDRALKAAVLDPSQPEEGLGGPMFDPTTDFLPVGKIAKGVSLFGDQLVNAATASKATIPSLFGVTAYHGSPYKFDKFSMGKVGTGEGAQAYGHGLYFAENPKVAKSYSSPEAKILDTHTGEFIDTREVPLREMANIGNEGARYKWVKKGHLYKTDIPDEAVGKMLDWDKPLSQQSETAKNFLQKTFRVVKEENADQPWVTYFGNQPLNSYRTRKAALEEIEKSPIPLLINGVETNGVPARAGLNEIFMQNGIPGIKYLDQGSRQAGKGTSNYVLFDENLAKILERK